MIGKLRHRVIVRQAEEVVNDTGNVDSVWTDVVVLMCALETYKVSEIMIADQDANPIDISFLCRYDPRVTAQMQASFGSEVYDIVSVAPIDNQMVYMRLDCSRIA